VRTSKKIGQPLANDAIPLGTRKSSVLTRIGQTLEGLGVRAIRRVTPDTVHENMEVKPDARILFKRDLDAQVEPVRIEQMVKNLTDTLVQSLALIGCKEMSYRFRELEGDDKELS
jgi:hypothetical protein